MKKMTFWNLLGATGTVAGLCLMQGCSTMYHGSEAEDMRLRPMPRALEPQPVLVTPQIASPEMATARMEQSIQTVTTSFETTGAAATAAIQDLTTDYRVREGDNLSSIAYRYGLRWQDVAAVNPDLNPNRIAVGQTIQLPGKVNLASPVRASAPMRAKVKPSATGDTYTVKAGDSLSVIAYRHGIKTADLKSANNLSGDKIIVGQKLVIPGGAKPLPVAAKPTATQSKPQPRAPLQTVPVAPKPTVTATETTTVKITDTPVRTTTVEPVKPPAIEEVEITPPLIITPSSDGKTFQNYTVMEGEDLYGVAAKWSVPPDDIREANHMIDNKITAGMVLKIPLDE